MKYQDILPDVLAGKLVRPCKRHKWVRMNEDGNFVERNGKFADCKDLNRESYNLDTWEVKPNDPEEIRIVIDSVSKSPAHTPAIGAWVVSGAVSVHQKYKLIPVDEETTETAVSKEKEKLAYYSAAYDDGAKKMWNYINKKVVNLGLKIHGSSIKCVLDELEPE